MFVRPVCVCKVVFFWLACCTAVVIAGPSDWKRDKWETNSVFACAGIVSGLPWGFDGSSSYYSTVCEYEPALGSLATCVNDILRDRGLPLPEYFEKSLDAVRSTCAQVDPKLGKMTVEQYTFSLQNASKYLRDDYQGVEVLFEPVSIERSVRDGFADAYHLFTGNVDRSAWYGYVLVLYVIGFCVVSALFRLCDITTISSVLFRIKFINYVRGYLTIPTLNGVHAADYAPHTWLSGLLPSRLETLVIAGFFLLNTLYLVAGYEFDPLNLLFGKSSWQITRFVADRSGILSISHVPLIILFSTRNNVVEYLTGFKYTTFIALHKWIGRSMILDVCVHSIAYSYYAYLTGTFVMSWHEEYWIWGSIATVVMIQLLIWSFGFIRRNRYELFLYLHILFAILFFYGTWKHLLTIGWMNWLLISLAIWILERFMRVARILYFGIVTATIQVIGEDLLRITIPKRSNLKSWKGKPGQYAFIHFLDPKIFWQSHPFTVIDAGDHLVVVARAKKGATRVVLQRVTDSSDGTDNFTVKMKVCVEGPYGSASPLRRFDNVLLLCGGSGLPGPLSHALELGELFEHKTAIDLVMSVKNMDILEAYKPEIIKIQRLHINLQIYITQASTPAPYGSVSNNIHEQDIITTLKPFAKFHVGRPDLEKVITSNIQHPGSLVILTCGPPVFVDRARDITAHSIIRNPTRVIEYFEEYQCW